jgi:hypothetical protein
MQIPELFDFILAEGCGVNITSLKKSKKYLNSINSQKSLLDRFPETTNEGLILRAGHLVGGTLLNCYPEATAIGKTALTKSPFGHGIEMRTMITATGNAIVAASKKNWPKKVHRLAEQWDKETADGQITLTQQLYHLFTTEDQRQKVEINLENVFELINDSYENSERLSGTTSVLPLKYGKWNKKKHMANCQGKTQMLVAFAKTVGAKVLLMLPNTTARDVLDELKVKASYKILEDIENRKIKFPDESFMKSVHAGILKDHSIKFDKSFHLCPVIQVKDGRWVVIDSNALNWGVLDSRWNIDEIYSKLLKYEEVLPGLSLGAADYEQRDRATAQIWDKVNTFLEHSKKLQDLISTTDDMSKIIEIFVSSGEFDFIFKHQDFPSIPIQQMSSLQKQEIAAGLLFGPLDAIYDDFLNDPENFLLKKKESAYTYYHCLAVDSINDNWNDTGIIVHPEAYFTMNPEYHIAISALNSVGIDKKVPGLSAFIADYCFCQTTLHNAMMNRKLHPELSAAAAKVIEQLPYQHELSKRFLTLKK